MTQDYTSTSGATTTGAIRRGFDNHTLGESYDRDKQSSDWDYRDGGSNTAAIAEISDEESYSGGQSLKVNYSSAERAKTASKFEIPEEGEYYLSYWVYFPEDFSFNGVEKSGGKLPGLGADEVPTGGDEVTGDNGFSARYMWRYDGQAELYLYHMDKAGTFGDSVKFRNDDGEYKFFQTGQWHNIIQRVKVNEGDDYNGEVDVWLDGEQVVDIDGVRLSNNGQGVDVFYLSTFYGGGSTDWLPPEDTEAYFDEIVISTNPEDVGLSAADIRPPSENPDTRPVGNGVVKGIQEFQPETTEQELPDGSTGEIYHDKQWGDGYTATLFYTPASDASNWTIQVKTPGPIEDIWNAEIVSYEDGVYTLRGTTKPELDAGETANVRIKGEGHGALVEFLGGQTVTSAPTPVDSDPVDPDPVDPEPVDTDPGPGASADATPVVTVDNEWHSGFTASISFTPDRPVSDWAVQIHFDGDIENIWNGEILARDGDIYTIGGVSYNADLDAGETARIKIKGVGDAASLAPVDGAVSADGGTPVEPTPDPIPSALNMDLLLQLVDTDTDTVLAEIADGQMLPEGLTDGRNVSVVVSAVDPDFADEIGSVRMTMGDHVQTESYVPYALFGDARGDFRDGVMLPEGTQQVRIEVFSDAGAGGQKLTDQITSFEVQAASETDGDTSSDTGGNTEADQGSDMGHDAGGIAVPDSPFTSDDYSTVLNKSMQFYYAQYAGELSDDHPISWRGDSVLDDGAEVGRDLSGGWFDAGDHVKFGLPMAFSATMLAWGGIEFEDGYKATGAYDDLDNHLRHVTDYLLQAYDDKGTASVADDMFHAQVGNAEADHSYWGPAEELDMERPVYSVDADNPGTEVTGEPAAALAASSIFFREQGDTAYADVLLAK
ncbi:MAG: glycoside hydrolase family 9 protein, partial [Pseudomonadota bacterium]